MKFEKQLIDKLKVFSQKFDISIVIKYCYETGNSYNILSPC